MGTGTHGGHSLGYNNVTAIIYFEEQSIVQELLVLSGNAHPNLAYSISHELDIGLVGLSQNPKTQTPYKAGC